jgi:hypothetical protein
MSKWYWYLKILKGRYGNVPFLGRPTVSVNCITASPSQCTFPNPYESTAFLLPPSPPNTVLSVSSQTICGSIHSLLDS